VSEVDRSRSIRQALTCKGSGCSRRAANQRLVFSASQFEEQAAELALQAFFLFLFFIRVDLRSSADRFRFSLFAKSVP
jgi:hypothetical protein